MAFRMKPESLLSAELNISTKITNLEERTANLEQQFEAIAETAKELANVVKCYVDKVETERKSWDVIDSIMEQGTNASDIFSHVKIFFNFLLSKMAGYGADITDVTMLWHLYDKEGVHDIFRKAIKSFGFKESDEGDIRVLLAVVYKQHQDMEREHTNDESDQNAPSYVMKTSNKFDESDCSKLLEKDFTKLTVDSHVVKLVKNLHFEDSLRKVIKRMMTIVVYLLNVGRADKTLSIVQDGVEKEKRAEQDGPNSEQAVNV